MVLATPVADTASLVQALAALRAQADALPDEVRDSEGLEIVVAPWGGGNPVALREAVGDAYVAGTAGNANAARNLGAAMASGDHFWFLDHLTRLRPGSLALMYDVVAGSRDHRVVRAVGDRGPFAVASYLFAARHWIDAGLSFDEDHGDFPDATCAWVVAASRPTRIDAQLWDRVPPAGAALGEMPRWRDALEAWLTMVPVVRQLVHGPDKSRWVRDLLVHDLPGLLADADRLPVSRLTQLADVVGAVLATLPPGELARVPVEARAGAWLAGQAQWGALADYLALRAEQPGDFPTRVDGSLVHADLPGVDWEAVRVPPQMLEVGPDESRATCSVRRVRWPVEERGLTLVVDLFVGVRRVDLTPATIRARWVSRDECVEAELVARPDPSIGPRLGRVHLDPTPGAVSAQVSMADLSRGTWSLQVEVRVGELTRICEPGHRDRHGSAGDLHPAPDGSAQPVWGASGLRLLVGGRGAFERDQGEPLRLAKVSRDRDELVLHASGPLFGEVELRSATHTLVGEVDGWRARFRLLLDPFGTGEAPAPPGRYRLFVDDDPIRWEPAAADDIAFDLLTDEHRIGVRRTPGGEGLLVLGPPLADDELGRHAQHVLRSSYPDATLVDRVLLESDGGRACAGSALAIDAALARNRPDLPRLWVVADHSVTVPRGSQPVLRHSRAWHEALAGCRWLVTDGDLPDGFGRREGQHVVRLAGYPATTTAVARWERLRFSETRIRRLVARSAGQWTTLVVPTLSVEHDFRGCFGYDGEVLATGTPATDLMVGDVSERRALTRARLGIHPDQAAVLYAHHAGGCPSSGSRPRDLVDPAELCDLLGDDYVVLLRAEGTTRATPGHPRLVDVSTHPDPADLVAASDAALVDFAALRFDYAVTGKPMVFHVPDPSVRTGDARGFLFPYADTAPGPFATTTGQVADLLLDLDRVSRRQAAGMARLNARFNDLSDGAAAERVVASVFGPGYGRLTLAPEMPDDDRRSRFRVVRSGS